MKFWTTLVIAAASIVQLQHPSRAAENVGVRQIVAPSPERGTDLDVTVWYPAQAGGERIELGSSPFFVGTPSSRDAPLAPGRYPVILLSHGAGLAGNAQALSWIATPLARHGYIVAAPTHPGNTGPKRSAAETMKLWLRPADLTATFDALAGSDLLKDHLDSGRLGVLGLSMGGNTALAISGARLSPTRLAAYCDTDTLNASLCGWVRQSGVDLHKLDMTLAGRDNTDPRMRFAMAIDPAPVDVFDPASFSGIDIPVEIINLGRPDQIPLTTRSDKIARSIPGARYAAIADAGHYSMFGECKPGAAELAESKDLGDPICSDGGGRSRREIHAQLVEMAITAFDRGLNEMP